MSQGVSWRPRGLAVVVGISVNRRWSQGVQDGQGSHGSQIRAQRARRAIGGRADMSRGYGPGARTDLVGLGARGRWPGGAYFIPPGHDKALGVLG